MEIRGKRTRSRTTPPSLSFAVQCKTPKGLAALPVAAIVAILIVAGVEFAAWQFGKESPVAKRLETQLSVLLGRPVSVAPKTADPPFELRYDNNPFFNQPGHQSFMPFIALAGAGTNFKTDYFGFRNHLGDDVYSSPHKRPVIVMTGNSELAGIRHAKDIASLLEDELRRRGMEFDVLNLAAASYNLAAEIGAYIHFGDKVCPSLVIAHSGGIEHTYGMVVPKKFSLLGLAYHPPLEEWAYRMYNLREYTGPSVWRQHDRSARLDDVVRSTGLLLDQYRSLVERNKKTKFLFGAQKTDAKHPLFPFLNQETKNEFTTKLRAAIDRMGIDYIWFEDDPEVTLTDPIHSDAKSAEHIVKVYANWIEEHRSSLPSELASDCRWSRVRARTSASSQ
jgi:hypothetical protein